MYVGKDYLADGLFKFNVIVTNATNNNNNNNRWHIPIARPTKIDPNDEPAHLSPLHNSSFF